MKSSLIFVSKFFVFVVILIVNNHQKAIGQVRSPGFSAGGILGFTASQIDGDDLAGYNKLGLTVGIRTSYPFRKKSEWTLELLYSQRGSRSSLSLGSTGRTQQLHLQYIEIPVLYSYGDWWQEEDGYFKVRAEAGLSYGNLFSISSTNSFFNDQTELFRKNDLSYLMGIAYRFNSHWGMSFRFQRSFIRIFNSPNLQIRGLQVYFLSFRSEYHF